MIGDAKTSIRFAWIPLCKYVGQISAYSVTASPVLAVFNYVLSSFSEPKPWVHEFEQRVNFSNLNGKYAPKSNPRDALVAGTSSPMLNGIESRINEKEKAAAKFQANRPRSGDEPTTIAFEEIRNWVFKRLFPDKKLEAIQDKFWFELFPGTSRAMEVACRRPSPEAKRFIILSPFEHPTEKCVADWIKHTSDCEWDRIFLPQNWEEDVWDCLLYTSPSPRDQRGSRMPSSA